jgi:hypothetical protein
MMHYKTIHSSKMRIKTMWNYSVYQNYISSKKTVEAGDFAHCEHLVHAMQHLTKAIAPNQKVIGAYIVDNKTNNIIIEHKIKG